MGLRGGGWGWWGGGVEGRKLDNRQQTKGHLGRIETSSVKHVRQRASGVQKPSSPVAVASST